MKPSANFFQVLASACASCDTAGDSRVGDGAHYERGSPSYYGIPAGKKNFDVRGVQICVRKLEENSSVGGVSECAALPLQRATTVVKLASTENIFRRESLEFGKQRY
jgi:hypothetical protein